MPVSRTDDQDKKKYYFAIDGGMVDSFENKILKSRSGSIKLTVREKQELIHYLTKEVTEQNSDCIDEKNTFIKKQMNVFSNPETV